MTPTTITITLAGLIAMALAIHSVITMNRKSVWPTIFLFGIGSALVFEGLTLGIVTLVSGR